MVPGTIHARFSQNIEDGSITSCSLEMVAVERWKYPSEVTHAVHAILGVGATGMTAVYGKAVEVQPTQRKQIYDEGIHSLRPIGLDFVWLKSPNNKSTTVWAGAKLKKTNNTAVSYVSEGTSVAGIVNAATFEKKIQIGIRGPKVEKTIFGLIELTSDEREQYTQCLTEVSAALEKREKVKN